MVMGDDRFIIRFAKVGGMFYSWAHVIGKFGGPSDRTGLAIVRKIDQGQSCPYYQIDSINVVLLSSFAC